MRGINFTFDDTSSLFTKEKLFYCRAILDHLIRDMRENGNFAKIKEFAVNLASQRWLELFLPEWQSINY